MARARSLGVGRGRSEPEGDRPRPRLPAVEADEDPRQDRVAAPDRVAATDVQVASPAGVVGVDDHHPLLPHRDHRGVAAAADPLANLDGCGDALLRSLD